MLAGCDGQGGHERDVIKIASEISSRIKMGLVLYMYANGLDTSEVCTEGYEVSVKSVGNSCTAPRNLENDLDAKNDNIVHSIG